MKKLIVTLILMLYSGLASAQADRITVKDSLKASRLTNTFIVNSRHNYNTAQFDSLSASDSIKIWHVTEDGRKYPVSLRNLNTWLDLESNFITGYSGATEFLILHPNLYSFRIEYLNVSPTKTIKISRRGNNLK